MATDPSGDTEVDLTGPVRTEADSGQPDRQLQQAMLITINDTATGVPTRTDAFSGTPTASS